MNGKFGIGVGIGSESAATIRYHTIPAYTRSGDTFCTTSLPRYLATSLPHFATRNSQLATRDPIPSLHIPLSNAKHACTDDPAHLSESFLPAVTCQLSRTAECGAELWGDSHGDTYTSLFIIHALLGTSYRPVMPIQSPSSPSRPRRYLYVSTVSRIF